MSYQTQYSNSLNVYQEKLEEYKRLTENSKYSEIVDSMPFDFLEAEQFCDKLSLYAKMGKNSPKARMTFTSAEDAIIFYKKLISFKNKTGELLEDASCIVDVGEKATDLNFYVENNPYLGEDYKIAIDDTVTDIARRCLRKIPDYPKNMTKEFRWHFIESAIYSLSIPEIDKLVDAKVIKGTDIDHISLTEEKNEYQSKITHLCAITGHTQPIIASYPLKLKGVTFPNADGSSRQEHLKALKAYVDTHPNEVIQLSTESYTYHPEMGEAEPAVRIFWGTREIGNIPRVAAEELQEKFDHPQCTAILKNVTEASDKLNAGCTIILNVIAPQLLHPEQETPTQVTSTFPAQEQNQENTENENVRS